MKRTYRFTASALVLALMLGRNIWLNSHGGKH